MARGEGGTLESGMDSRLAGWVENTSHGAKSVLELGCGYGQYLNRTGAEVMVGIDSFEPYIVVGRKMHPACELICGDMLKWAELVGYRPFDYVQFIDSLEHVEKEDAIHLLLHLQQVVKRIGIFLPIGPHVNDPCDGNDAQRHLSEWTCGDLSELGFLVQHMPNYHHTNPPGETAAAFCSWNL